MFVIVAAITYWVIRFGVPRFLAWIAAKKAEPTMAGLRIPAPSRELAVTVQPPADGSCAESGAGNGCAANSGAELRVGGDGSAACGCRGAH